MSKEEAAKPREDRYEIEERAAIKEFCGNLPREIAEQQALAESTKKQKRGADEIPSE